MSTISEKQHELRSQHYEQQQHQQKQHHQGELKQYDHKAPADASQNKANIQQLHIRSNLIIHSNDINGNDGSNGNVNGNGNDSSNGNDANQNNQNQNHNHEYNKHKIFIILIGIIIAISTFTIISQLYQYVALDKEINSFVQSSYHELSKQQHAANNIIIMDKVQPRSPRCSDYLPYSVFDNPPIQYYHWYGRLGRSFETGHLYERHLAVEQKCTTQQTRQKKTVFLNMNQLGKAFNQVIFNCDLNNYYQFEYKYDGIFNQKVRGIDCSTGNKVSFSQYFIFYKRATKNYYQPQYSYMRSMAVTLWTFYPKRGSWEL